MPVHEVQQGECLAGIADQYGFSDWRTIYNHANNSEFRRKRINPNVLFPGDQIFIPEREVKYESAATERRHRFQARGLRQMLRIAVQGPDGQRLAGEEYELVVDRHEYRGMTDEAGLLEEQIPLHARNGKLVVGPYSWEIGIAELNPAEADTSDAGVSGIQGRLLNLGYDVGPVDGVLGPRTENALKAFQKDNALEATGSIDDATRSKLIEVHGC